MKRRLIRRSLFVLLFALWTSVSALIAQEILVVAQHQERTKERVIAEGLVHVRYKDIVILADRIFLNTETKEILAEGSVTIRLPNEVISMESIRFNMDSWEGTLKKVRGMVQPSVFYGAEKVEIKSRKEYGLIKATLTSCTQPVPRWKFSCSKANFKKDDYFEMWNAVFSIKKIPIFYLPYFKYPIGEDRSTGLLTPQLGFSGPKGMFYSQSLYLAIKRNMDATINFDLYSARGVGGGLEYRYLFHKGTGGQLKFYYFNFKEDPERSDPDSAYIIRFNHKQMLPFGFNLVADVDLQSSYDFLREFDNNYQQALISHRRSQIYLSKSWSYFNLSARVSKFETHFIEMGNSIIRKSVPELRFSSSKIKLFSPLYFSFSSVFQRWEYGWESEYEAGTQRQSQSLTFVPSLTVPFNSIPWMTLTSTLTANMTYYFQSYAPGSTVVVDEPVLSKIYSVNFLFTGPVFSKIFHGADGEAKLKHIIEPYFSYRYDTHVKEPDRFISIGYFYRNHYIQYGLTNRFFIKQDDSPREIFSLSVAQTFFLEPEESYMRIYEFDGKTPEFSDVSGNMRFYPGRNYSINFSVSYNPYYKTFNRLKLSANLGNYTDPAFLRVSWYKSINPWYQSVWYNRHQIGVSGGLKIPALSIETLAEIDFNIQKMEILYSAFSLTYHYQCLDFIADVRIFFFREKPELQFRFSFVLGNIGKTTDFFGGLGF